MSAANIAQDDSQAGVLQESEYDDGAHGDENEYLQGVETWCTALRLHRSDFGDVVYMVSVRGVDSVRDVDGADIDDGID